MKKLFLFPLISILLLSFAFSYAPTSSQYSFSSIFKQKFSVSTLPVPFYNNGQIVLTANSDRKGGSKVSSYNKNGRFYGELKIKRDKNIEIDQISYNGKAYLDYRETDKAANKYLRYVREINPLTLGLGAKIELGSYDDDDKDERYIKSDISDNKKTRVIIVAESTDDYEENFIYQLFDKDFKKIATHKLKFAFKEFERFDYIKVNNDGSMYVNTTNRPIDRKARKQLKNALKTDGVLEDRLDDINFYIVSAKGEVSRKINVKFPSNLYPQGGYRKEILGTKTILSGFYNEEGELGIRGSFFIKINNETGRIIKKSFKQFDEELLLSDYSEKSLEKIAKKEAKGKEINTGLLNYKIKRQIMQNDGGVIMVAEQDYLNIVTRSSTDANGNSTTVTTYYYHLNGLIVTSISPTGDIEWIKKIDKEQFSVNDGGFRSSFALLQKGNKLYFYFNTYDKMKPNKGFFGDKIMEVWIDNKGKTNQSELFNETKSFVTFAPRYAYEDDENKSITMFGFGRKKDMRIVEIKL